MSAQLKWSSFIKTRVRLSVVLPTCPGRETEICIMISARLPPNSIPRKKSASLCHPSFNWTWVSHTIPGKLTLSRTRPTMLKSVNCPTTFLTLLSSTTSPSFYFLFPSTIFERVRLLALYVTSNQHGGQGDFGVVVFTLYKYLFMIFACFVNFIM